MGSTLPSVSSGDAGEDAAFMILKQDDDSQQLKTNIIVHPTQRIWNKIRKNLSPSQVVTSTKKKNI